MRHQLGIQQILVCHHSQSIALYIIGGHAVVILDMVEGLLRQKNTVEGVVVHWGTEQGVVLQWGMGLQLVVAEGRMCGTRGRHIVLSGRQAHENLEGEADSSLGVLGSWSRLYFVYL